MSNRCPMELFLEYISAEERLLQRMADGKSMKEIVRDFQNAGYKSYEGAKMASIRRLASEVRTVLERICRDEGEAYSVPILESLKERALKARTRTCRAKQWWYRRRKDSVLVIVGNRRGAIQKDDAWRLSFSQRDVFVSFPDGTAEWLPSSTIS